MNLENRRYRRLTIDFFLVAIFILLLARFFYLQIYRGAYYRRESEKNRVRQIISQAPRGMILDRHGEILVNNYPAYSVFGIPYDLQNADSVFLLLSQILKLERRELKRQIEETRNGWFQPVKLKRYVDFPTLSLLEEYKLQLPGIQFLVEPRRAYRNDIRASHVLGYIGEISNPELAQLRSNGYVAGDIIGKRGLERSFESILKGTKGVTYIEVDAFGRRMKTLTDRKVMAPIAGADLILTLDADLQRTVEQELARRHGAVVVLDVTTGEVLAFCSKPDYDPEFFSRPRLPEEWNELSISNEYPLYNRVIQGAFPPGSTFKLILALAALESKKVDLNWQVDCHGSFSLGKYTFDCWKKGGHGRVTLLDAIEQSCNVYFYNLMLKVGLELWSQYGQNLGFGNLTGIDLPGEKPGLLPTPAYFEQKHHGQSLSSGYLLNLAVGQGELLVTVMQMAVLSMIIANEGTYYRPHIVKSIRASDAAHLTENQVAPQIVNQISRPTFQTVKQGMYRVVMGEKGTGRGLRQIGLVAGGKTGTAQNPAGADHAWFIGFAPYQEPQIAFCVFVETGGTGGAVAVPIARKLLSAYFMKTNFGTAPALHRTLTDSVRKP